MCQGNREVGIKKTLFLTACLLPVLLLGATGRPAGGALNSESTVLPATWVHDVVEHDGELYVAAESTSGVGRVFRIAGDTTQVAEFGGACMALESVDDTLYVGLGSSGLVLKSGNLSAGWDTTFPPDGATHVYALRLNSSDDLLIGAGPHGDVFVSNYDYELSPPVNGPTWVYSAREHGDTLYMCTDYDNAELWRSVDGGSSWQFHYLFPGSKVYDIFWDAETAYVGLDESRGVMRSTGGNSWREVWPPDGATDVYRFFQPADTPAFLVATGGNGDVFAANWLIDTAGPVLGGATWVYDVTEFGGWLMAGTDYTDGELWKSLDGGSSWSNLPGWSWSRVLSLQAVGPKLYAGTDYNGNVFVSSDSGVSWDSTGNLTDVSDPHCLFLSEFVYPARLLAGTGPNGDVFLADRPLGPDVSVDLLLSPPDTVFLDTTVVPAVVIANNGTAPASLRTWCRIGAFYVDSQDVALVPGQRDTLFFTSWQADSIGNHAVCCSCALSGDVCRRNNHLCDTVAVVVLSGGEEPGTPVAGLIPGLLIAPNPTSGRSLQVAYALPGSNAAFISVCDVTGRVVASTHPPLAASGRTRLDLRGLSAGVYLVRLETEDYTTTRKLVIQR